MLKIYGGLLRAKLKLFSKNSNLYDHNTSTSQTDRRTDGQLVLAIPIFYTTLFIHVRPLHALHWHCVSASAALYRHITVTHIIMYSLTPFFAKKIYGQSCVLNWNYFPRIPTYMTTIPQRHRQTDKQTDGRTTCFGNSALSVASRGSKKYFMQHCINTVYTFQTAARVVLTLCQCKCRAVPSYYRGQCIDWHHFCLKSTADCCVLNWNYFPRIPKYMTTMPQRHRQTDRRTDNVPRQYRAKRSFSL